MDAMERETRQKREEQPEPYFDPNWEWKPDWESDQDPEPISSWGKEYDAESGAEEPYGWEDSEGIQYDSYLEGRRTRRSEADWDDDYEEKQNPFQRFVSKCKQKLEWEDDPDDDYEPSPRSVRRGQTAPAARKTASRSKSVKKTRKVVVRESGRRMSRAGRIVASVLRYCSALFIIFVTANLAAEFFSGYRELGSIKNLMEERNVGLAVYLGAACVLVGFGILSVFWTLSRRKMADGERVRYYDTGRGGFAFLCFGALSLCAGLGSLLPDGGSLLNGVQSFLSTISSSYGTILPLCIVGFVCCLARKFLKG
ncbi:hypothetical protein MUB23_01250 [Cuneatibacter sp. NSJ-177]|uniref:hypothetical protein n=1 Tax=Cuneatibacter sp. NSJ-177 TaxID=2931401 RepID=UPI001FD0FF9E|nr:hypothetical protein [Cuneatibacter sp. NSJ-177]MCJ7834021.1 hypothetical protein [Cuneatibacter sp. NSJ-177]